MSQWIYAASVALALVAIGLFLIGARRLLRRETELVASMLSRYDERLAEFAQTLNDALSAPRPGEVEPFANEPDSLDTHSTLLRMLELATERTAADGAFAALASPGGPPTIASVRLSHEELTQIAQIGLPDYHGARAIQVAFNQSAGTASDTSTSIRSGLFVPLLDSVPSTFAVLTRSGGRRFSDEDIEGVESIVAETRPVLERALALREPDPVPALDPLTDLYDRKSFFAVLDREIARARQGRYGLTLLVLDVDRLTTLNAQLGRLGADEVLAQIADVLRQESGREGLPARLGGGSYAILLPREDSAAAERLFARCQESLAAQRGAHAEPVSLSAGVAELSPDDDSGGFVSRANAALGLAKQVGRGTMAGGITYRES
jgi:diguanylate cyclase (GGDEF)-like protein